MKPLVSVIIPTYNRANMVCEAVSSVLDQNHSEAEILVIDDGSTDKTEKQLHPIMKNIRYYRQEHSGVSVARNRGFFESKGELIAFLDSDDLWRLGKLKTQVLFFKAFPVSRICHTDELWIRHGRRVNPRKKHYRTSGWIFEDLCHMSLVSPSSVMIRRNLLEEMGGFDESLPAAEDFDLWLRISLVSPIHYISRPLVIKRGGHSDQISRTIWGIDRFRVTALLKALDNPSLTPSQRDAATHSLLNKCRILAQGFLKRGCLEKARHYFQLIERYREVFDDLQGSAT